MYSLYLTREYAESKPFILNNADLSIDPSILQTLVHCPEQDAIAVDTSLFNDESMKIDVDENGVIVDISKGITEENSFGCSIDFYKFSGQSSSIFFGEMRQIIEGENNLKDWTEVAMQRLMQSGRLHFRPCDISGKPWVEVDNYEDLALSDRVFSRLDDRLEDIDNILLDLDGTVYVGSQVIPGVADTIRALRDRGKSIYFLSNNSSKAKDDYVARLAELGIDASATEIVLSTDGLVSFLKRESVTTIHVLGTNSLKKVFMDEGFRIDSESPEYVVLGYDTELNYPKLMTACKHINDGVDILATHADAFCPTENGPMPDIGALIDMIETTTGKRPRKIFGKPDLEMVTPLVERYKLDPRRTLIVGDRLHTDIAMSKSAGCYGMLVLTGETSRDRLENSEVQPDFVLNSIAQLSSN